jgi:hypothetical protein
MAIIIGALTDVNIGGETDGLQSVNWNTSVQPNRLWQLGDWNPYKTQVTKTITVSVTTYAQVLGTVALAPAASCADSTAVKVITIDPGACDVTVDGISETMYITSYSYSKGDPIAFGTESWSFQVWKDPGLTGDDFINVPEPTYVLQGIAEGTKSGDVTNLGVVMNAATEVDGAQGSVSAGFPGIGNADVNTTGIVTQIGGGTLEEGGKVGQSSANIPHQPLYLS